MIASFVHDPAMRAFTSLALSIGIAVAIHRSDLYDTPKLWCQIGNLVMAVTVAWQSGYHL